MIFPIDDRADHSLCVSDIHTAQRPRGVNGKGSMKSHHTMSDFYGEVEVEVCVDGVRKSASAARDDVIRLIDDTIATYSENLAKVYLVISKTGSTRHAEQRGFTTHDGMNVKVEATADFLGVVPLGDARTYLGSLVQIVLDRIEQYLIDKIDDPGSVLVDVQGSVDTVLNSPRVLV